MRHLAGVLSLIVWCGAGISGVLAAPAPTATAALSARLAGHWQCRDGTQLSYAAVTPKEAPAFVAGRVTTPDGGVVLEHITSDGGGAKVALYPGVDPMRGTLRSDGIRAQGTLVDGSPVRFTLRVDGTTLRRDVVMDGDAEHQVCTREPETAYPTTCINPNVPPATIDAVEPQMSADMLPKGKRVGTVLLAIALDDRSDIVDARVIRSVSPAADREALRVTILSKFRTTVRNCRPLSGATFTFAVEFEAD